MLSAQAWSRLQVMGCLVLVYASWGSSFISIRFALESFPPFLMIGSRMFLAGVLLYALTWFCGERRSPSRQDWLNSCILAFFMVFVASGFLALGQGTVASGTAALLMGSVPIWMVLGGWLIGVDPRPSGRQLLGLLGGFAGLILLSARQGLASGDTSWEGLVLVMVAALGWVAGSLYSKRLGNRTRLSLLRTSALLMFLGGVQCVLCGLAMGEWSLFQPEAITARSLFAYAYLVIAGGIVAYSSYFWLLMHTRTEIAISYEYVDPIIGIFLGWLMAGEQIDAVIIAACVLTVGSVFFLVSKSK